MDNKELLDNIDIMISEVEWGYPIDHAATLNKVKEIIKDHEAHLHTIDKYEQDILAYEKALDKACEELSKSSQQRTIIYGANKEQWKEWLLKNHISS